jgi:hypothetical protein
MTKDQALKQQKIYSDRIAYLDEYLYTEYNTIDFDEEGYFFEFEFKPRKEIDGFDLDIDNVYFEGGDDADFQKSIMKLDEVIDELKEIANDDYIDNYNREFNDYKFMIRNVR